MSWSRVRALLRAADHARSRQAIIAMCFSFSSTPAINLSGRTTRERTPDDDLTKLDFGAAGTSANSARLLCGLLLAFRRRDNRRDTRACVFRAPKSPVAFAINDTRDTGIHNILWVHVPYMCCVCVYVKVSQWHSGGRRRCAHSPKA